MNSIEDDIRKFLSRYVAVKGLSSDTNLFEAGFMTSLFAAQLITFVETHFKISVPDEYLEMRNFATVASIRTLIDRLRSQSPAVI